jgi:acyl-coenzyme A thioesterase PaaI-like protein
MKASIRKVLNFLRFYPPYLGAGVSVKHVNEDMTSITVQMKMRFWNRNYVGTHFGGSLYSMCDPWYMFILLEHLGKECVIWDKTAEIDFVAPGKGTMTAVFEIDHQTIDQLRQISMDNQKHLPVFHTTISDESGNTIATVKKTLYVRRKRSNKKSLISRPERLTTKQDPS